MKRRNFIKGLFVVPFVKGSLPNDLVTETFPTVEETVPLSKIHGPMVTGAGSWYPLPVNSDRSDQKVEYPDGI